jgi:hypothetical protein
MEIQMKIAALTMVYNESVFLPIWLYHYGQEFGYENLFVIDDGSTDACTLDFRVENRFVKGKSPHDEDDRARLISFFHEELLQFYDIVLYSDVDEIIVADPKLNISLFEYLISDTFEYKTLAGFDVLHRFEIEKEIDLSKPLFQQRRFVDLNPYFCKPLISTIPMRWEAGFHDITNRERRYDLNLPLFHLRGMDIEIAKTRFRILNRLSFTDNSIRRNLANHYRWTESDYMNQFCKPDVKFEASRYDMDYAIDFLRHNNGHDTQSTKEIGILRLPDRFEQCIRLSALNPDKSNSSARSHKTSTHDDRFSRSFRDALNRMATSNPSRRRNDPCPCGSNKRYKHCHGFLK